MPKIQAQVALRYAALTAFDNRTDAEKAAAKEAAKKALAFGAFKRIVGCQC